jgi:transcriptional regulator with XRE-family HTH domain
MDIGKIIRSLRKSKSLTLKQLAEKAGCTDAYISQLENGRANPSIMILKNIATALGIQVVDLFLESPSPPDGIVVREKERINMDFKHGDAVLQLLVHDVKEKRMQPFCTTIEPGGGAKGFYSHTGEDFGIVIEGCLELNLNGKIYRLEKNDSFYFSAQEPHTFSNPGDKKAVVIWVVSPPSF